MAITGEAVLIANSNQYGQGEGAPRGCAGDGTHLYVVGNNRKRLIRVTNLETFASEYASAAISGGAIQSLAFLGGNAYFSAGTALHRIDAPLTGSSTPSALTGTLPSNIFSLASDGTYLYGYRQNNNTIHRITISGQTLTVAAYATVTFPTGVSANIRSFFYHDGAFYFVNLSDNRLYKSPENVASGSTVAATRVGNFTNFGASVTGVHGAGVLNENAYIASGASDNLYRLYNVRWDETIDAIEVDEGGNASLDLSGVSQDATSFAFAPSHTSRSWLTLSGTNLVITNAPAVSADTDFQAVLRAVRGSVNAEKTLTVTVQNVATVPSAPLNLRIIGKGPNYIDLAWDAPTSDGGAAIEDYEVHADGTNWVATGSTRTTARITGLRSNTQYTLRVRAVNSAGAGPASNSVTEKTEILPPQPPAAVPPQPSAPEQVAIEMTPTTAEILWKAPTNGAVIDEYEISSEEGSTPGTEWVATGSTETQAMVKGLKRQTAYTFQVRARNEQGAGLESAAMTQMTPIASLHNALFFKECVNYFDDGARVSVHGNPSNIVREVADNNYKTFTREKDLVLNIAVNGQPTRVDAIFVKGIDIEGHSAAPNGGTGVGYSNRRMPATVKNFEGTEVSTIVAGFQHDLFLLDSHFTAKEVRMTFTGSDAKIVEVMCLEFGLEIDANGDFTEINPDFVDREGIIHSDPGGGIVYDSPIGADERDKWEVDYVVRVVPGKTILQTPEEFLYWRSENRNHVHAQEFTRFPWRVFPATFLRKSVPVRYRTDDKTGGQLINFRVAEQ